MKIKKYITFPEDYFHMNGVPIEDGRIDEWVDDIIGGLKESNKDNDSKFIGSGDTMVFGFKSTDEDGTEYEVYVCPNYYELSFSEKDLIKSSLPKEND